MPGSHGKIRVQVGVLIVVPRGSTSSCVEERKAGLGGVAFVQVGEGWGRLSSRVSRPLNMVCLFGVVIHLSDDLKGCL